MRAMRQGIAGQTTSSQPGSLPQMCAFAASRPRLDWNSPADVAQLVEHFTRNEETAPATEPFPRNRAGLQLACDGQGWSRAAPSSVIGASLRAGSRRGLESGAPRRRTAVGTPA